MELKTKKYSEEIFIEDNLMRNEIELYCYPCDGATYVSLSKEEAIEVANELLRLANK